jgi:hypothetical protein
VRAIAWFAAAILTSIAAMTGRDIAAPMAKSAAARNAATRINARNLIMLMGFVWAANLVVTQTNVNFAGMEVVLIVVLSLIL